MDHYTTGRVIAGRYVLAGVLGEGGYGVVHRAVDLLNAQAVAVKLLRHDIRYDREFSIRLLREAQALSALHGTSAVEVYDIGNDRAGVRYLVMELLSGRDFEHHLRDLESKGARLPVAELFEVLDPVVATLEVAHAQGIVHRDLKPSNIFLTDERGPNRVRLLDFGLAKILGAAKLTAQGKVAGSPHYIAPEAWAGNPSALDHRIDLYSLGVLVFRALAGRTPFTTKAFAELLYLTRYAPRPSLVDARRELPPAVDDWVKKAFAPDPNERFQDVRSMWNALRAVVPQAAGVAAYSARGR
ncbi:MAG TPA: serine/threonine-protein kinase [Polyangiaceae bacterium]|nr:serine/threonine-protein kinase [Polyangiaceae bacterium]